MTLMQNTNCIICGYPFELTNVNEQKFIIVCTGCKRTISIDWDKEKLTEELKEVIEKRRKKT